MLRNSLLAFSLVVVGCGGRVFDAEATDGGVDAVADVDASARPDVRGDVEFACPTFPPTGGTTSCRSSGTTCSYPCGATGMNQTFRCEGGFWRPMSYCEMRPPPPPPTGTVGKPCFSSDECDVTGEGINICSRGAFAGGDSLYPTPVCIGVECEPGTGPTTCDGTSGLCLPTSGGSAGGICLPRCTFRNGGAAPEGCVGKNMCWPFGRTDSTTWWGYCFGGCSSDSDCPTGQRCDPEQMMCVKTVVAPTKPIGAACESKDAVSPAKCACIYSETTSLGYCSRVCRVGVTSCPSGFACDPMLPDGDPAAIPSQIAGYCLKTCTSDLDCVNSKCEHHAGMPTKTCSVERPF